MEILIGLLFFVAGGLLKQYLYYSYLEQKAIDKYRSPIKIGKEFYYIIPEKEYIYNKTNINT